MVKVSAGLRPAKPEQGDSLEAADAGESAATGETVKSYEAAESGETTGIGSVFFKTR